jgi:hypothetical protein
MTRYYKGGKYIVVANPEHLREEPGWLPFFTLAEDHLAYMDDTVYWGQKKYETKDEAMSACFALAERVIGQREGVRAEASNDILRRA